VLSSVAKEIIAIANKKQLKHVEIQGDTKEKCRPLMRQRKRLSSIYAGAATSHTGVQ